MTDASTPQTFIAILAGGQSTRMGASDKATIDIAGQRLIDRVIDRCHGHASQIILSAPQDYGTGLPYVMDDPNHLAGPAAGLWAIARWATRQDRNYKGFYTSPVDAPCFPLDLFVRLGNHNKSAVATTASSVQPTFAYWEVDSLLKLLSTIAKGETLSLRAIAKSLNAVPVLFDDETAFANINTPAEADTISQRLATEKRN